MYQNLKYPINTSSGTGEVIYVALLEWFQQLQKPEADKTLIANSHQFHAGKGFLQLFAVPQKNNVKATPTGELGGNSFNYSLQGFLAGSYGEQHSFFKAFLNKPLIVLVKDPFGFFYQIGSEDLPAYITPDFSTSNTKDGSKGYAVNATTDSNSVVTYTGIVAISPDELNTLLSLMVDDINFLLNELDETIETE